MADFERVQKELTLQGNIVISVGIFGHNGYEELWKEGGGGILQSYFWREDTRSTARVSDNTCNIVKYLIP
ncbi:MAG: hypothetical protein PUB73_03700 [Bacteroidales bacterium]|nr:hypothetical protein [Bacteroidales bacterium]